MPTLPLHPAYKFLMGQQTLLSGGSLLWLEHFSKGGTPTIINTQENCACGGV
jgi:hypothetical protein